MRANVYLCGPPGAGKTTTAPLLAALRGMAWVDVDAAIEAEVGCTIAALVDREGLPAFRGSTACSSAVLSLRWEPTTECLPHLIRSASWTIARAPLARCAVIQVFRRRARYSRW